MDKMKFFPTLPAIERQVTNQTAAQLRKVLDAMFPRSYVQLYHHRPRLACPLFKTRTAHDELEEALSRQAGDWHLEASTEPASRGQVVNLRQQFQDSLLEHQAKPVGLCPIRRAIYDQCFDELIRQVTVSCIEQGLLLFQVRNELRLTISYYRRAYESSVTYGLRKAMAAKLEMAAAVAVTTNSDKHVINKEGLSIPEEKNRFNEESKDNLEQVERMRVYYESELAKRDGIIAQQREVIKLLGEK